MGTDCSMVEQLLGDGKQSGWVMVWAHKGLLTSSWAMEGVQLQKLEKRNLVVGKLWDFNRQIYLRPCSEAGRA